MMELDNSANAPLTPEIVNDDPRDSLYGTVITGVQNGIGPVAPGTPSQSDQKAAPSPDEGPVNMWENPAVAGFSDHGADVERDLINYGNGSPREGSYWDADHRRIFSKEGYLEAIRFRNGTLVSRETLLGSEEGKKLIYAEEREHKNETNGRGFFDALTDVRVTDLPFIGMLADVGGSLAYAGDVKNAMLKVSRGEKMSLSDAIKIQLYDTDNKVHSGGGVGAMVGDIVRHAPGFVMEFFGFNALGGAIRTGIVKHLVKTGGEGAAKRLALLGANTGAKVFSRELATKGVLEAAGAVGDVVTDTVAGKVAAMTAEETAALSGKVAKSIRPFIESTLSSNSELLRGTEVSTGLIDKVTENIATSAVRDAIAVNGHKTAFARSMAAISKTVKERTLSAMLDFGVWSDSPTTMITSQANTVGSALREGLVQLLWEAPIKGTLMYAPIRASRPLVGMMFGGENGVASTNELQLIDAGLQTGNRHLIDVAGRYALGMELLEYVSESAGHGFSNLIRAGGLASGLSLKVAPTFAGEVGGIFTKGQEAQAGNIVSQYIRRSIGTLADYRKRLGDNQLTAVMAFLQKNGMTATEAEARAFLKSANNVALFSNQATRDFVSKYRGKFTDAAIKSALEGDILKQQYRNYFCYTLSDMIVRHGWDADKVCRTFHNFGYDGIVEEMLEERYNDFAKGLLGWDEKKTHSFLGNIKQAFANVTTELGDEKHPWYEQLTAEAIGFSIPLISRLAALKAVQAAGGTSELQRARTFVKNWSALNRGLVVNEATVGEFDAGIQQTIDSYKKGIADAEAEYNSQMDVLRAQGAEKSDMAAEYGRVRDEKVRQLNEKISERESYRKRTFEANKIDAITEDNVKNVMLFASVSDDRKEAYKASYSDEQLKDIEAAQTALLADAPEIGRILYNSRETGWAGDLTWQRRLASKVTGIAAAIICGDPSLAQSDAAHWAMVDEGMDPRMADTLREVYRQHRDAAASRLRSSREKENAGKKMQTEAGVEGSGSTIPVEQFATRVTDAEIDAEVDRDGSYSAGARALVRSHLSLSAIRMFHKSEVKTKVVHYVAREEGWNYRLVTDADGNAVKGVFEKNGRTIDANKFYDEADDGETDETRANRSARLAKTDAHAAPATSGVPSAVPAGSVKARIDDLCNRVSTATVRMANSDNLLNIQGEGTAQVVTYLNLPSNDADADRIGLAIAAKMAGLSDAFVARELSEGVSVDQMVAEASISCPNAALRRIAAYRTQHPEAANWFELVPPEKRAEFEADIEQVAAAVGDRLGSNLTEEAKKARTRRLCALCALIAEAADRESNVRHYVKTVATVDQKTAGNKSESAVRDETVIRMIAVRNADPNKDEWTITGQVSGEKTAEVGAEEAKWTGTAAQLEERMTSQGFKRVESSVVLTPLVELTTNDPVLMLKKLGLVTKHLEQIVYDGQAAKYDYVHPAFRPGNDRTPENIAKDDRENAVLSDIWKKAGGDVSDPPLSAFLWGDNPDTVSDEVLNERATRCKAAYEHRDKPEERGADGRITSRGGYMSNIESLLRRNGVIAPFQSNSAVHAVQGADNAKYRIGISMWAAQTGSANHYVSIDYARGQDAKSAIASSIVSRSIRKYSQLLRPDSNVRRQVLNYLVDFDRLLIRKLASADLSAEDATALKALRNSLFGEAVWNTPKVNTIVQTAAAYVLGQSARANKIGRTATAHDRAFMAIADEAMALPSYGGFVEYIDLILGGDGFSRLVSARRAQVKAEAVPPRGIVKLMNLLDADQEKPDSPFSQMKSFSQTVDQLIEAVDRASYQGRERPAAQMTPADRASAKASAMTQTSFIGVVNEIMAKIYKDNNDPAESADAKAASILAQFFTALGQMSAQATPREQLIQSGMQQIDALRDSIIAGDARYKEIKKDLEAARKALEDAKKDSANDAEKIRTLEGRANDLNQKLGELQNRLDAADRDAATGARMEYDRILGLVANAPAVKLSDYMAQVERAAAKLEEVQQLAKGGKTADAPAEPAKKRDRRAEILAEMKRRKQSAKKRGAAPSDDSANYLVISDQEREFHAVTLEEGEGQDEDGNNLLNVRYADEVDPSDLSRGAIDAMAITMRNVLAATGLITDDKGVVDTLADEMDRLLVKITGGRMQEYDRESVVNEAGYMRRGKRKNRDVCDLGHYDLNDEPEHSANTTGQGDISAMIFESDALKNFLSLASIVSPETGKNFQAFVNSLRDAARRLSDKYKGDKDVEEVVDYLRKLLNPRASTTQDNFVDRSSEYEANLEKMLTSDPSAKLSLDSIIQFLLGKNDAKFAESGKLVFFLSYLRSMTPEGQKHFMDLVACSAQAGSIRISSPNDGHQVPTLIASTTVLLHTTSADAITVGSFTSLLSMSAKEIRAAVAKARDRAIDMYHKSPDRDLYRSPNNDVNGKYRGSDKMLLRNKAREFVVKTLAPLLGEEAPLLQMLDSDMLYSGLNRARSSSTQDHSRAERLLGYIIKGITGATKKADGSYEVYELKHAKEGDQSGRYLPGLLSDALSAAERYAEALERTEGDLTEEAKKDLLADAVIKSLAIGRKDDLDSPNKSARVASDWSSVINAYTTSLPETVTQARTIATRNSKVGSKVAVTLRGLAPVVQKFMDDPMDETPEGKHSFASMAYAVWKTSRDYAHLQARLIELSAGASAPAVQQAASLVSQYEAIVDQRTTAHKEAKAKLERARKQAQWVDRVIAAAGAKADADAFVASMRTEFGKSVRAAWVRAGIPADIADKESFWRFRFAKTLNISGYAGDETLHEPVLENDPRGINPPRTIYADAAYSSGSDETQPRGTLGLGTGNFKTLFDRHQSIIFFDTETYGTNMAQYDADGKDLPDHEAGRVVEIAARRIIRKADGVYETLADGSEVKVETDSEGRLKFSRDTTNRFVLKIRLDGNRHMSADDDMVEATEYDPQLKRRVTKLVHRDHFTKTNSDEALKNGVDAREAYARFVRFALNGDAISQDKPPLLVAHNAGFDVKYLYAMADRFGVKDLKDLLDRSDVLDTLTVARDRYAVHYKDEGTKSNMKLPDLYGQIVDQGLKDFEREKVNPNDAAHAALFDVTSLAYVASELDRQGDNFADYENLIGYNPRYGRSRNGVPLRLVYAKQFTHTKNEGGLAADAALPAVAKSRIESDVYGLFADVGDSEQEEFDRADELRQFSNKRDIAKAQYEQLRDKNARYSDTEAGRRNYFEDFVLPECRQTMTWPDDAKTLVLMKNTDRDRDDGEVVNACATYFQQKFATPYNMPEYDDKGEKNDRGVMATTALVPVYHGEKNSGVVIQVPIIPVFGHREDGRLSSGDYDKVLGMDGYKIISRFIAASLHMTMIGTDTKRAAVSSNEASGHAMRDVTKNGENRFHVLFNLGRDAKNNDGFIGTEIGRGYGYNVQKARASDKDSSTMKLHLMSAAGEYVTMEKGLISSVSDKYGRFVKGSALDVLDRYLEKFLGNNADRSTSTWLDRDAIKVGVLVNTTYGYAGRYVNTADKDDMAAALAAADKTLRGDDEHGVESKPAHTNLFDYIYARLDAAFAAGTTGPGHTLTGRDLDELLCDNRDPASGKAVADADGEFRFTWMDTSGWSSNGGKVKITRAKISDLLGLPSGESSIQLNLVDGLDTTDDNGRKRLAFDFSYVDNTMMSYNVANVSHEAESSAGRMPRNNAVDAMTYATGILDNKDATEEDKKVARSMLDTISTWCSLSTVMASDAMNVLSASQAPAIRDLIEAGANPQSEMVEDQLAYAMFKRVRDALNPQQYRIPAPLVSCGAVYRPTASNPNRIIDHTKGRFERQWHRGSVVYSPEDAKKYGRSRALGWAAINCRSEGFRYGWFVKGASRSEQLDNLRTTRDEVFRIVGKAVDPARGSSSDELTNALDLIEDIITAANNADKAYAKALSEEERMFHAAGDRASNSVNKRTEVKKQKETVVANIRKAIGHTFVTHHGVDIAAAASVGGTYNVTSSFADLFDSAGKFDRSAIARMAASKEVDPNEGELFYLGGSAFGLPRTPSYNGSMWLQVVRATTPVTEIADPEHPSVLTPGMDAMVSPDAQTNWILGCDHDGDKAMCYMLSGRYVDEVDIDPLDPLKSEYAGKPQPGLQALQKWAEDPEAKHRYIEHMIELGVVESNGVNQSLTVSEKYMKAMSDRIVRGLFDMARSLPVTVEGQAPTAERLFAGTDAANGTKAYPVTEGQWRDLKKKAVRAFDFLRERDKGVGDPSTGAHVGSSAKAADRARGTTVSLAGMLHVCRMSGAFKEVFQYGARNGRDLNLNPAEGWIRFMYMVDGISNATFDDIKEQVCSKLGWTPGMMDALFSDIMFSLGHLPTSEEEMYKILDKYISDVSYHNKETGTRGARFSMLLASTQSDSQLDFPDSTLKLKDVFPSEVPGCALSPENHVGYGNFHAMLKYTVFGEAGYASRDAAAKAFNLVESGTGYSIGSNSDIAGEPLAKERAALAASIEKYVKAVLSGSVFPGETAEDAAARRVTKTLVKSPDQVLADFVRLVASKGGSNAYAGLASWAIRQVSRGESADATAKMLVDLMVRSAKIQSMREFAASVNCLKADPGDSSKMARKDSIATTFMKVASSDDGVDGSNFNNLPEDASRKNALFRMVLTNMCAYNGGDAQTRLGRVALAAENRDKALRRFTRSLSGTVTGVESGLVLRLAAANAIPTYQLLNLEGNFQSSPYFLCAIASMPKNREGADIVADNGGAWGFMRNLASADRIAERDPTKLALTYVLDDKALKEQHAQAVAHIQTAAQDDTLGFHSGVLTLFNGLYAMASTADDSSAKELNGLFRFSVRNDRIRKTNSNGDYEEVELDADDLENAADIRHAVADHRLLTYDGTGKDRESTMRGERSMETLMGTAYAAKARTSSAAKLGVGAGATTFMLSADNVARVMTEQYFRYLATRQANGKSRLAAELDKVTTIFKENTPRTRMLYVVSTMSDIIAQQKPERGVESLYPNALVDLAKCYKMLAELDRISGKTTNLSPSDLFNQVIPLYATSTARVSPANPASRSIVDHIPGLVKRLTDTFVKLEDGRLDGGTQVPAGWRFMDLVATSDPSLAERQSAKDDPNELPGAKKARKHQKLDQSEKNRGKLAVTANEVTQLYAQDEGDEAAEAERAETLRKLRTELVGTEGTLRLNSERGGSKIIDVLNDNGLLQYASDYIAKHLGDNVDPDGTTPPAPEPPKRDTETPVPSPSDPAGVTFEKVRKMADALEAAFPWMTAEIVDRGDGLRGHNFDIKLKSKDGLKGSASEAFSAAMRHTTVTLGAALLNRTTDANRRTECLITIHVGPDQHDRLAPVDFENLDVNSPYVAASFCEAFNRIVRAQTRTPGRKKLRHEITVEQFMALTVEERTALLSAYGGRAAGGKGKVNFSLMSPSIALSSDGLVVLAGDVSVASAGGKNDNKVVFHELFHSLMGMFRMVGAFSEEDAKALRAVFGDAPKGSAFLFDEEKAADEFAAFVQGKDDFKRYGRAMATPEGLGFIGKVKQIFRYILSFMKAMLNAFTEPFSYAKGVAFDRALSASKSVKEVLDAKRALFTMMVYGRAAQSEATLRQKSSEEGSSLLRKAGVARKNAKPFSDDAAVESIREAEQEFDADRDAEVNWLQDVFAAEYSDWASNALTGRQLDDEAATPVISTPDGSAEISATAAEEVAAASAARRAAKSPVRTKAVYNDPSANYVAAARANGGYASEWDKSYTVRLHKILGMGESKPAVVNKDELAQVMERLLMLRTGGATMAEAARSTYESLRESGEDSSALSEYDPVAYDIEPDPPEAQVHETINDFAGADDELASLDEQIQNRANEVMSSLDALLPFGSENGLTQSAGRTMTNLGLAWDLYTDVTGSGADAKLARAIATATDRDGNSTLWFDRLQAKVDKMTPEKAKGPNEFLAKMRNFADQGINVALHMAGLMEPLKEVKDSMSRLMLTSMIGVRQAKSFRNEGGKQKHAIYTEDGGLVFGEYEMTMANAAAAMLAARGERFQAPLYRAMKDILDAVKQLPEDSRPTNDRAGTSTWYTATHLYYELARLVAAADETAIFSEGGRAKWARAVNEFFREVHSGFLMTRQADGKIAISKSDSSSEFARRNRGIYGLTDEMSTHDVIDGTDARVRLIQTAIDAAYVVAAQVKYTAELGWTTGSAGRGSARVKTMEDFTSMADITNEFGIGPRQLSSADPIFDRWNDPEFIAADLDSWYAGSIRDLSGHSALKKLFMEQSSKLRGSMSAITSLINRIDMYFGLNSKAGSKLLKIVMHKATHKWEDGTIKRDDSGAEYYGFDYSGGFLSAPHTGISFTQEELDTVDLLMKAANVKFRGGRFIVTGSDDLSFAPDTLQREIRVAGKATYASGDTGDVERSTKVALTKDDLSAEALARRFDATRKEIKTAEEARSEEFRELTKLEMALYKFDTQWRGDVTSEAGMDYRRRFVDAVFAAYDAAKASGFAAIMPGGTGLREEGVDENLMKARFNDFILTYLSARGFVCTTSQDRDVTDPASKRRLQTSGVLALQVSDIEAMWPHCSAYEKLVAAGRDKDKLTVDSIVAQFREPYMKYLEIVRKSPWLTGGDARYLNNYGTPLQSFVGDGMFMAGTVKAARNRRTDALIRITRHEATYYSLLGNEEFRSATISQLSSGTLNMIHEYFDTEESGQELAQAIMHGEYRRGSRKSVYTGLELEDDADGAAVAMAVYQRLLEIKVAYEDGRDIRYKHADESAVGRMVAAYENAAKSGAQLTGAQGLTDEQVFSLYGKLPASMTLGHAVHTSMQGIQNALYFRSTLVNMLMTPGPDGKPLYFAKPNQLAVGTGGIPDVVWKEIARWWSEETGKPFDVKLSGVENARRIYDAIDFDRQENNGRLFTSRFGKHGFKYSTLPRDEMDTMSIDAIMCRADDGDNADSSQLNAIWSGSEALGYAKHLFTTSRVLGGKARFARLSRIMSWSKSMSVSFSVFFKVATKMESPTAAVGGMAMLASNLGPEFARNHHEIMSFIQKAFTGFTKEGWIDENFLGYKDIIRMMDSDDPFLNDLIMWAETLGITMTTRLANPMEPGRAEVLNDVDRFTTWLERAGLKPMATAVGATFKSLVEYQSDKTFTYALNATKLAVAAQMMLKLKAEAVRAGKAFDPIRDMAGYAEYIDSEIGGVNPLRYAWANPKVRRTLNLLAFSWEWTRTAWEAGGGGIIEDIVFGGHHVTKQQRNHTFARWLRMYFGIILGVPFLMQFASKLFGLWCGVDDDDDEWLTWNNESDVGMYAANLTPMLKGLARLDETVIGRKLLGLRPSDDSNDFKKARKAVIEELYDNGGIRDYMKPDGNGNDVIDEKKLLPLVVDAMDNMRVSGRYIPNGPLVNFKLNHPILMSWLPIYTGVDEYNRYGIRKMYGHFGKQGLEFGRYRPSMFWPQLTSKLSRPVAGLLYSVVGGDIGNINAPTIWGDEKLGPLGRFFNADPVKNGFLRTFVYPMLPFSFAGMASHNNLGFLTMGMPTQVGTSYYRLYSKVSDLETRRVTNDRRGYIFGGGGKMSRRANKAKANDEWGQLLYDARVNGISPNALEEMRATALQRTIIPTLMKELFSALPQTPDGPFDVVKASRTIRALHRAEYKYDKIYKKMQKEYMKKYGVESWKGVDPRVRRRAKAILKGLNGDPFDVEKGATLGAPKADY